MYKIKLIYFQQLRCTRNCVICVDLHIVVYIRTLPQVVFEVRLSGSAVTRTSIRCDMRAQIS